LDRLRTVTVDSPVVKALEIMGRDDVNQLPVTLNGDLEGIISRSHILQLIQTKAEIGG
jgi:CBS domain-containing protein